MRVIIAMDVNRVREAAKAGHSARILEELADQGITFDSRLGKVGFLHMPAEYYTGRRVKFDEGSHAVLACDAQPELVTAPNGGIPAYLTNWFDPKLIQMATSPMQATEIVGSEEKKGDWTTTHAQFITVELTGETSAYGDFNNNGSTNMNADFPIRQSFLYQTFTQWGELQLARMGNARIDYANKVNEASVLVLNKFQNASYFFGISGIPNYGLFNDPSLYPSIVSATAGGWNATATTGDQVYEDIRRMFVQMQYQSNGTINAKSPMTLGMSPTLEMALTKTNQFNVNVQDQLKKNFPALTVKTAVEYQTGAGEFVQLICNNVGGQETATTAFTEKMRAHAVVVGHSSWSQKKSQGTFGTVIFNSTAIASLIGA